MKTMFGMMLSAALLCGSAAMARTEPCDAQLHAQISALQAQVALLQANSNVQSDSIAGYQLPTGG